MKRKLLLLSVSCLAALNGMAAAQPASLPGSTPPTWVRAFPGTSPLPADWNPMAIAYDSQHHQAVMFGGIAADGVSGKTWLWDGSNWTLVTPAASPSARGGSMLAYDSRHGQVVLFGGWDYNASYANPHSDTWLWDGSNWTQAFPANSPPARGQAAMTYDSLHGEVVLFGGFYNNPQADYGDTWLWDGANWTEAKSANAPSARYRFGMAFDPQIGAVTLFGGVAGNYSLGDTWLWDGINWTQAAPAASPAGRFDVSMAYDPQSGRIVLFGGCCTDTPNPHHVQNDDFDDTWLWDGTTWTQAAPARSPSNRRAAALSQNPNGGLVLWGGIFDICTYGCGVVFLDDTWLWRSQ